MQKSEVVSIKKETIMEISCDKCLHSERKEEATDDFQEEWIHIEHTGGYGSKFIGDMNTMSIDLCEVCFYNMFKDIAN